MRKLPYALILTLFLTLTNQCFFYSQTKKIDSLKIALSNCRNDTSKIKTINALGWQLSEINPDTAIILSEQALKMSEKLMSSGEKALIPAAKNGMFVSLGCLGKYYTLKSEYSRGLDYYLKALKIAEGLKDKSKIAAQFGNIGNVYLFQTNYPDALEFYLKNLKLLEEIGDKKKQGGPLGNIGIVYRNQGDHSKALAYFNRALKIEEEFGNKKGILRNLGNIGNAYSTRAHQSRQQGDTAQENLYLNKSLEYLSKALKIGEGLGNKSFIALTVANMANIYADKANNAFKYGNRTYANSILYPKAFEMYFKGLKTAEEIGDKNNVTMVLSHLGSLYTETGKYNEAFTYLYRSLAISTAVENITEQKFDYEYLSTLYETSSVQLPDTVGGKMLSKEEMRLRALYYYKKFMSLKDTIFSQENKDQLVRKELNYDFEKKEAAIRTEQEKKDIIAKEELKQKENQRNYFIIGFALIGLLALFILKGYKEKQKANRIITQQKNLVDMKQQEILDSIHYAKRIQTSLLPTEKYIERVLSRYESIAGNDKI